jgi:hypothetical protein
LTYKANGKTVSESFATPAKQRKAKPEIETRRRYRQVERPFVEVNEKICHARPAKDPRTAEKKTAEAIQTEIARYPVPLRPPSTLPAALTTAAQCSGQGGTSAPLVSVSARS